MSVFSKKFEALLLASPMFKAMAAHSKAVTEYTSAMSEYVAETDKRIIALEERIVTLEGQVNVLASTTRSLMETVTQLVRGHTTNRKAIEELYNFVTEPAHDDDLPISVDDGEPHVTSEEIEAYKKSLN